MEEIRTPLRVTTASDATDWLRRTDVPDEYQGHELIRDRVFLTLPAELLEALDDELAQTETLASGIELALSRICRDHSSQVGFSDSVPISYPYLRRPSNGLNAGAHKLLLNQLPGDVGARLRTAERRLRRHFGIAKSYAGWLLTNRQYIDEQDNLLRASRNEIVQWGLPNLARPTASKAPADVPIIPAPALHAHVSRFEEFYLRWRLSGLAAANLPVPIPPQSPAPAAILAAGPMVDVGAVFYLPDTYPVLSRDELRAMLEDSLRGTSDSAPHLAEWTRLIRSDNSAKNAMDRFGKILEVQHYCRILQERHSETIKRRQGKLELALSKFLKVSDATIHNDLILVRKRLGADWMRRGNHVTTPP
jgi:hypothetical protein